MEGVRKVVVERLGRNETLKLRIREISLWESILLEIRLERKERLELCLRAARLKR